MLLGGLVFSGAVYLRKRLGKSLQFFLRLSVFGQAIFMLLQGYAVRAGEPELFFGFRCGWGFFFVSSFGLIISLVMRRVYPRQRTFACAAISLTGLFIATVFLFGMALISPKNEQASPWLFFILGTIGVVFFMLLLFKKVPFGEPVNGENDNEPSTDIKLKNPRIWQTMLPLIGIGLFTFFIFELVTKERLESLGYSGDEQSSSWPLAFRYFFTFIGTAVSCWLSFRFKRRKATLLGFMLVQLASLVLLACLFKGVSQTYQYWTLLFLNALLGFSTGTFLLSIITAAESFGNRLRPTATIFITSMYRSSGLFIAFVLASHTEPPKNFADFTLGAGVAIVLLGMVSVLALDSSNFDGNADLSGFDLDIFDPNSSTKFLKTFDGINHDDWLNPNLHSELLKVCNKRIFEKLHPIFGDWLYHCVLYEYNQATKQFLKPEPENNEQAWFGLEAKESQFRQYLNFAGWMLEKGKMKSLIEAGFVAESEKLNGIIIHNLNRNFAPPEGYACVNLSKVYLSTEDEKDGRAFFQLADSKVSQEDRLEILKGIQVRSSFSESLFGDLFNNGFSETAVKELHRTFIVRKIESLQMPGEYFLTLIFPKGGMKVALAILAANEKVQSKMLEVHALLSGLMLVRAEKIYAKTLQEKYLDREVVLPNLKNVKTQIKLKDVVALELQDGLSTIHFRNSDGELSEQTFLISEKDISNYFLVEIGIPTRHTPGALFKCHRKFYVNLEHNWQHRNANARVGYSKGGKLIFKCRTKNLEVSVNSTTTRDFILPIISAK
jgi:MFS family permease